MPNYSIRKFGSGIPRNGGRIAWARKNGTAIWTSDDTTIDRSIRGREGESAMVERVCYEMSWMSMSCGKEYGLQPCKIIRLLPLLVLIVRRWSAGSACNTSAIDVVCDSTLSSRIRIFRFLETDATSGCLTRGRMSETNVNKIESPPAMF